MSARDEDEDEEEKGEGVDGYCHFNEDGSNTTFDINVFGLDLSLVQNPASRTLGHGAVVWDASVVLAMYMQQNPSLFTPALLREKTVLELGSGCGLGGICFMLKGCRVILTDLECVTEELTEPNAKVIQDDPMIYNKYIQASIFTPYSGVVD